MVRRIGDLVVVITGASSGIGRATAQAFAEHGATVVLAARGREALHAVAEESEQRGGRAVTMVCDVGDEAEVFKLAERATEMFGRIDLWINNAAVTLFGRIEDLPSGAFERVVRTNLFGYAYGARAIIPIFREQGAGTLINVASVVAFVGQPYTSAYVASKWAIRGLSECLRMELLDAPGIHVCTVYPPSVDTPLFQHGANYSGRAAKPMEPVHAPEEVADVILDLARSPRREAFVGTAGRLVATGASMAPAMMERMMARRVELDHFQNQAAPPSSGNLARPMWDATHGGWRQSGDGNGGRLNGAALVGATLVAAVPLGILAWKQVQARRMAGRNP